jgi:hypothetical protein
MNTYLGMCQEFSAADLDEESLKKRPVPLFHRVYVGHGSPEKLPFGERLHEPKSTV